VPSRMVYSGMEILEIDPLQAAEILSLG